jgi:hypothetical protein
MPLGDASRMIEAPERGGTMSPDPVELRIGDRVVAEGHRVGADRRTGEVIEITGEPDERRCRVRWDDGHETLLYPGTDVRRERAPEEQKEVV